jgi:uncharacterized protein (TIGR04255 family)
METNRYRPHDLPEFDNPPLNEVVLGVQFAQPQTYRQIQAWQVWDLFRDQFPNLEEQSPLAPTFETFGPQQPLAIRFGLGAGPMHDRYWFVSGSGDEVIQFQNDRLLHNWRKQSSSRYIRYENIRSKFHDELNKLKNYLTSTNSLFEINQCEVTYVNHIPLPSGTTNYIKDWLNFFNDQSFDFNDLAIQFKETIFFENTLAPSGRFYCDAGLKFDQNMNQFLSLALTVRGQPVDNTIDSSLRFFDHGRSKIVRTFADITTGKAHEIWGRSK